MSDIVHRASWGFFAIRGSEFTCCHGSPETGHHAECPYDKTSGPLDLSKVIPQRGYNFHDSSMALRHGPESAFAKNYVPQSVNSQTGDSGQAHSPQVLSSAAQSESGHSVPSPRGRKSKVAAVDSRQATLL